MTTRPSPALIMFYIYCTGGTASTNSVYHVLFLLPLLHTWEQGTGGTECLAEHLATTQYVPSTLNLKILPIRKKPRWVLSKLWIFAVNILNCEGCCLSSGCSSVIEHLQLKSAFHFCLFLPHNIECVFLYHRYTILTNEVPLFQVYNLLVHLVWGVQVFTC